MTVRTGVQAIQLSPYTPYADVEGPDRFTLSRLLPQYATLPPPFRDLRAATGRDKLGAYKNSLHSWLSEIALLHTTDTAHDFDIGLVEAPADPNGTLAAVEFVLELRAVLDHPAVDGGMIDLDRMP